MRSCWRMYLINQTVPLFRVCTGFISGWDNIWWKILNQLALKLNYVLNVKNIHEKEVSYPKFWLSHKKSITSASIVCINYYESVNVYNLMDQCLLKSAILFKMQQKQKTELVHLLLFFISVDRSFPLNFQLSSYMTFNVLIQTTSQFYCQWIYK